MFEYLILSTFMRVPCNEEDAPKQDREKEQVERSMFRLDATYFVCLFSYKFDTLEQV